MSGDDPNGREPALKKLEAPLRSEEAMFRIVVYVGLACAPIILAGLIISPLAGAIMLLVEIGLAIGVWLSRRRSRS